MSLTICVVVYNEERNLSVIEHNLRLIKEKGRGIELLLIDNASTDRSTSDLEQLSLLLGVRFILRMENSLPQARHQALISSSTKWVGFIDADCRIDEFWIQQVQVNITQESSLLAGFGGPWIISGQASEIYQVFFQTFLGHLGSCYLLKYQDSQVVAHIPTANVVYDREKVLSVGGFCSSHPHVGEDLDLSYRLNLHGYRLRLEPSLAIQHELPATLISWVAKMFLYGTARGETLLKYALFNSYSVLLPLWFFPFFLLSFLVSKSLFVLLVGLYLSVCVFCSLQWSKRRLCLPVTIRMIATHVCYAAGLYYGFVSGLIRSLTGKSFLRRHRSLA